MTESVLPWVMRKLSASSRDKQVAELKKAKGGEKEAHAGLPFARTHCAGWWESCRQEVLHSDARVSSSGQQQACPGAAAGMEFHAS